MCRDLEDYAAPVKRPRKARLLSLLVAALVATGVIADVPAARATDHGLTTFSAPLGVAPDPQNPGIYKGTVVIGWHANGLAKAESKVHRQVKRLLKADPFWRA